MSLDKTANLNQWLNYLTAIHPKERDFGLDRIKTVLSKAAWRNLSCPVISVAGTNGKGSCVKVLESIWLAAGYQVGAYTSPHLYVFNERICLNGEPVDDQQLVEAFSIIEKLRADTTLTFFEYTTLAALYLFSKAALDVVILEVGLGGRLDAVNIVDADLSIISTIDLDHCDLLGNDRESIAYEKAGIIRHGCPVVCGDKAVPATLVKVACEKSAPLHLIDRDFVYSSEATHWSWQSGGLSYQYLPVPNLKMQNCASSLMAIDLMRPQLPVSKADISAGLKKAVLIGRRQFLSQPFSCWLDVAHNAQSVAYLVDAIASFPREGVVRAVFSMLKDKNIAAAVSKLIPWVDEWYIAPLPTPRALPVGELSDCLVAQSAKACYAFDSIADAVSAAVSQINPEKDCLVVFGSFYTVAEATNLVNSGYPAIIKKERVQ